MFQLEKLEKNLTKVTIRDVEYYFSYDTCIGFKLNGKLYVSENIWSKSTGAHINKLTDKTYNNDAFNNMLKGLEGEYEDYLEGG